MKYLGILFFISLLASCESPYLAHEYRDFEQGFWPYDSTAVFQFEVSNTQEPYDLYYRVRNNREYPYYNLYVKCEIQDAQGNLVRKTQDEVHLLHPKEGRPLGNGESLYDHEVLVFPNLSFEKAGKYEFHLKQFMRLDTLEGITAVGFSLKKGGAE